MQKPEIILLGAGLEIHYYLDAEDTHKQFTMFKCVVHPGAKVPVPHYHDEFDETFYILKGPVSVTLDGKTADRQVGEHVFIPKGTPHGFHNPSNETVEILCYAVPGIFTAEYFRAISKVLSASGAPDVAKLKSIMQHHGLTPVAG